MVLEYVHGSSFVHRVDIRTKVLVFGVVLGLSFMFTSPVPNGVLTLASVVLLLGLGLSPREAGRLLAPLTTVVVLIVVFAALSPPAVGGTSGEVVGYLWFGHHLPLTVDGLLYGASLGLRILTLVSLTGALILCTPVEHVTALLRSLRTPFPITFMVTTALRFVPTMQRRARQIRDAQRARGAKVDSRGIIGSIRTYVTIMVPLLATGIRMSEGLAAAMLCRGYGISKHPTPLVTLRMTWRDPVLIVFTLGVLAGAVWLRGQTVWTT